MVQKAVGLNSGVHGNHAVLRPAVKDYSFRYGMRNVINLADDSDDEGDGGLEGGGLTQSEWLGTLYGQQHQ